ncbi:MAG: multiheme c-type cytochrome [Schlesneria sp.]
MIYTTVKWNVRSFALVISFSILFSGCKPSAVAPPKPPGNAAVPGKSAVETNNSNPAALPAPESVLDSGPKTAVRPYLDGWDKPAIAFLLTGEQHGYLEPCGCSETQSGGMARRADLVRIVTQEKGWELVGLDVGGTLKRSRRQDQIKFEKLFEGFQKLHYSAVGVGLEELKLGADFILTRMPSSPEDLANSVALVSANVVLFDQPDLGWPLRYRLIEKSGLKIGVTSVFGPSLRDRVAPVGVNTNITLREPDEVLPDVIKSLEESKPDLMVLLCHGNEQEALSLAKAYPQFRIVLAAGGYDEPDGKPIPVGKSWVLNVGHKGKRVGILGFYPDNADQPFRFELIQLDKDRFKNHPEMRELMKQYQQQLQDEGIAISDELLLKHSSGQTFVGAEKCGGCHTKAFAHWKETGHGVAFTTLKEGPWHENRAAEKIDWIQRQFDPECLSCHITGWHPQEMLRYESGYIDEKSSAHLLGQQCENCHGPGSMHVSREENSTNMDELLEGRQMVRRTLADAKKSMCIECHDSDNSPKFTPERFDEFWKQVSHPFKD